MPSLPFFSVGLVWFSCAMVSGFIPILLIALLFVTASIPVESVGCSAIASQLLSCNGYVTGRVRGNVPPACCNGMKKIKNMVGDNTKERRKACSCIQKLATELIGFKDDVASKLPKKCGVEIPYKISKKTDCSKLVDHLFVCLYISHYSLFLF